MKRRNLLIALGAGLAVPFSPFAQQQDKVRRIGFLAGHSRSTTSSPNIYYDAFLQGMRELGYVEGRNLAIEWRFADGKFDRLPALAAELVQLAPEVILTHGTPGTIAAQRATRTIPIVFATMGDPVRAGVTASLARPGGNVTGLSIITGVVAPKQVELLKSVAPTAGSLAYLWNPTNLATDPKSRQAATGQIGWKFVLVEARTPQEIAHAFDTMTQAGIKAAIVSADGLFIFHRRLVVELAVKHRILTMHSLREDVEAGALISYGQNLTDYYRRAATYVDKILKGARPGELPVEQPTKIHLAINKKTAQALGITISKELLFRADEVIE